MDKKIVKAFGRLFVVLASLVAILSFAALVLMVLSLFIKDFLYGAWFIPVFGEFLFPIQILINPNESNGTMFIIIALAMFLLCVAAAVCAKKVYKYSSKSKKASLVTTLILSPFLFAYSVFNLVVICIYYQVLYSMLGTLFVALLPGMDVSLFANLFMIKFIVICALLAFASIFVFFVYLLNREKEKKQVVKQLFSLNFYSDEYEKKEVKEEIKEEVNTEESAIIETKQKPKKQSQDLLERIMQLNELKDTGQITEVEYTRLRQKAIRRYKV